MICPPSSLTILLCISHIPLQPHGLCLPRAPQAYAQIPRWLTTSPASSILLSMLCGNLKSQPSFSPYLTLPCYFSWHFLSLTCSDMHLSMFTFSSFWNVSSITPKSLALGWYLLNKRMHDCASIKQNFREKKLKMLYKLERNY